MGNNLHFGRVRYWVAPAQAAADKARHEAFKKHVLPEIAVLLRVARTLTSREQDAQDLVQDTLLRAFRGADRFDGAYPRAWLLTIMRNAQANRTRRRRPQLLDDPESAGEVIETRPYARPEESLDTSALEEAVVKALHQLPDRMARPVQLVDMDGLSYAEAAEALGIPIGTVMSRLHRGRAKIKARLQQAGFGPERAMT